MAASGFHHLQKFPTLFIFITSRSYTTDFPSWNILWLYLYKSRTRGRCMARVTHVCMFFLEQPGRLVAAQEGSHHGSAFHLLPVSAPSSHHSDFLFLALNQTTNLHYVWSPKWWGFKPCNSLKVMTRIADKYSFDYFHLLGWAFCCWILSWDKLPYFPCYKQTKIWKTK